MIPSKMIGGIPKILNFNRLFLKLTSSYGSWSWFLPFIDQHTFLYDYIYTRDRRPTQPTPNASIYTILTCGSKFWLFFIAILFAEHLTNLHTTQLKGRLVPTFILLAWPPNPMDHVTKALWTPPINSHARKISAVDCNMRDLKAPILSQFLVSLLTRVELEKLHIGWNLHLHPLMILEWKISNSILQAKDLWERWCQRMESNLYLFISKAKGASHQLQAPFHDQPGGTGGELHWEHWEPTQMLSYNQMSNQPLHLANIDFSSTKFSSVRSFFQTTREIS